MAFNRKDAEKALAQENRLPPGQVLTQKWPVLHVGNIPQFNPATAFHITQSRCEIVDDANVLNVQFADVGKANSERDDIARFGDQRRGFFGQVDFAFAMSSFFDTDGRLSSEGGISGRGLRCGCGNTKSCSSRRGHRFTNLNRDFLNTGAFKDAQAVDAASLHALINFAVQHHGLSSG